MKYTKKEIARCLKLRRKWYQKAIDMNIGIIKRENGFDWPTYPGDGPYAPENITHWRGAIAELENVLAMFEQDF